MNLFKIALTDSSEFVSTQTQTQISAKFVY